MSQNYVAPFLLIRWDGWAATYDDLPTLAAACRAAGIKLATAHRTLTRQVGTGEVISTRCADWIARDLHGTVVAHGDHQDALGAAPFVWCRDTLKQAAADRGLPIPFTGKRIWGQHYRAPRHIGVRREVAWAKIEVRHDSRAPHASTGGPPSNWDDIWRTSHRDRNWKQFRRTRWIERALGGLQSSWRTGR